MIPAHVAAVGFVTVTWLLALGWLWQAVAALRGMPTLPDLTRLDMTTLPELSGSDGPHLTVIVPACNEEKAIQATLRSLLASTGLRLEIIAVDDRSTDRTGKRMNEIAEESSGGPHSLKVIHNHQLPEGWLGKPHALTLGAECASAPWLLFTDADVVFSPTALELALRYMLQQNADSLVLMLTLLFKNSSEGAAFAAFQAMSQWSIRLWKVADPRARDFFGAGGFSLVRREVYTRLGGLERLRMEVIEDLSFAWMVKRGGYSPRIVVGPGLAEIHWIQGALGIVSLLEKNGFAGFRYRMWLTLLVCLGFAVQMAYPLWAMATGGWGLLAGLLTYTFITLTYVANRRVTQVPPWLALFFAPATAILLYAILRSMILTLMRGGVSWRGTLYPLAELRQNMVRWR
jgi:glycosyltransferase involved in cell wall biosynthesis